jgi:hypothetical protein
MFNAFTLSQLRQALAHKHELPTVSVIATKRASFSWNTSISKGSLRLRVGCLFDSSQYRRYSMWWCRLRCRLNVLSIPLEKVYGFQTLRLGKQAMTR